MKLIPMIGAVVGLGVIAACVAEIGAFPVARALQAIGWPGFAAICLIHVAVIAGMGLAWRAIVPAASAWLFFWGRLVRDMGAEILPFSQIGGLALGARAVALGGISAATAAASTLVDVTLELAAKQAYLLLGFLWLLHLQPGSPAALPATISLLVAGCSAVALLVGQHRGFDIFRRFTAILAQGWADQIAAGASALRDALAQTYRRKGGLWAGFLLHFACWIASALEVWVALRLAGLSLEFGAVLVIESVLYGIRTFAFAIPNAVGVQEATYVLVGASFGLTPDVALAVSLLKRARDLAIGLPTLALWQAIEGGRLWRRSAEAKSQAVRAGGPRSVA